VERSATPGEESVNAAEPATAGESGYMIGNLRVHAERAVARCRGLNPFFLPCPGVPLRFSPGSMLSPAPQAVQERLRRFLRTR
jgi:hypothetical protein